MGEQGGKQDLCVCAHTFAQVYMCMDCVFCLQHNCKTLKTERDGKISE